MMKTKAAFWLILFMPLSVLSANSDVSKQSSPNEEQRLYTEEEVNMMSEMTKRLAVLAIIEQLKACHLNSMFYIQVGEVKNSNSISYDDVLSRFDDDQDSINIVQDVYESESRPFDLALSAYSECSAKASDRVFQ